MRKDEWLTSNDPAAMLRSLNARWHAAWRRGGTPDFEKLRQFACACCRRLWALLDADHRHAVEIIERYIHSRTKSDLRLARRVRWEAGNRASSEVSRVCRDSPDDRPARLLAWARNVASSAVWQAADKNPATAANCHKEAAQAMDCILLAKGGSAAGPDPGFHGYQLPPDGELVIQATLLREIVGNPFAEQPSA